MPQAAFYGDWGVSPTSRKSLSCHESPQWVIPINAEKPKDARIKSGRYIKTKSGNGENEDGKKTV